MTMKDRDVKRLRTAEPAIRVATPAEPSTREPLEPAKAATDRELRPHLYHPEGKPRPTHYLDLPQQPFHPCPDCDRIKTDQGSRAVVFDAGVNRKSGKAYGRCRCCGVKVALLVAESRTPQPGASRPRPSRHDPQGLGLAPP